MLPVCRPGRVGLRSRIIQRPLKSCFEGYFLFVFNHYTQKQSERDKARSTGHEQGTVTKDVTLDVFKREKGDEIFPEEHFFFYPDLLSQRAF